MRWGSVPGNASGFVINWLVAFPNTGKYHARWCPVKGWFVNHTKYRYIPYNAWWNSLSYHLAKDLGHHLVQISESLGPFACFTSGHNWSTSTNERSWGQVRPLFISNRSLENSNIINYRASLAGSWFSGLGSLSLNINWTIKPSDQTWQLEIPVYMEVLLRKESKYIDGESCGIVHRHVWLPQRIYQLYMYPFKMDCQHPNMCVPKENTWIIYQSNVNF